MRPSLSDLPTRFWLACIGAFILGFGIRIVTNDLTAGATADAAGPRSVPGAVLGVMEGRRDSERTTSSYRGLGAWIDAFDYEPAYQPDGGDPPLAPDVVDDMGDRGVRTIYIQAARRDDRATGALLNEGLLAEILLRAHARDMDVVAWYLPLLDDVDADLDKVVAMADFSVRGHRFDGIAIDIEYTSGVPDPVVRSDQLIALSDRLRATLGDDVIGAIVPAAVHLEVINPHFWPGFPWRSIDPNYDVWLPMTYSSDRTEASGYRDSYTYSEESTRRMRVNLNHEIDAHIIGGIGDQITADGIEGLSRAIEETGAIGGSIYDWNSMTDDTRRLLPGLVQGAG